MEDVQFERIVDEVTRRLMALDHSAGARSSRSAVSVAAALDGRSARPAVRTLQVTDRVVTMACLSGRLEGITHVKVAAKAIVTPLVVDELREKGIRLERQSTRQPERQTQLSTGTATDRVAVSFWLVADAAEGRRVAALLEESAGDVQQLTAEGDVAAQVATMPSSGRAVVCTSDWAKVVCRMNRNETLRAAVAWDAAALEEACRQVDPNVLVIDSSRMPDARLRELVDKYMQYVRRTASDR